MMPLQDSSQMVQTPVSNVQMPLFTQQGGKLLYFILFLFIKLLIKNV